jgi:hypothetical protein
MVTTRPGCPGARRWHRVCRDHDRGSAVVEFLGISLILLIPLVYLVLTLAKVQGASYAVEGAARDATRAYLIAPDEQTAAERAVAVVRVALQDQGIEPDAADLAVVCSAVACLTPEATITATVTTAVSLPGAPAALGEKLSISVSATSTAIVEPLRAAP